MFNAISNMIIKASDNINRGVDNAGKAGEGNNGQDYQLGNSDNESSSGGYTPTEQTTSGSDAAISNAKNVSDMGKSALSNIVDKGEEEDTSDERLKNIFGDNEDIIKIFSKIKAIQFTYNDKAKKVHPNGENQVDDDVHLGIKAQDLEKNPLTASTVSEDASGFKQVNTQELTMANSAVISELCRRIEILEKILGVKVV